MQGLESLAKALHVEVLELRRDRARALASRGLWGHCKNLLGYLLSAYCLFRCNTSISIDFLAVEWTVKVTSL